MERPDTPQMVRNINMLLVAEGRDMPADQYFTWCIEVLSMLLRQYEMAMDEWTKANHDEEGQP